MNYSKFISEKKLLFGSSGFEPGELNDKMFPFQKDFTAWAIRKGRACLFEECGLGKTIQQLEWAKQISAHEKAPVLGVAPLAVNKQTKREGEKFGYRVNICESSDNMKRGINITNYEKLHRFSTKNLAGVFLDESSILKNMSGVIRNQIIDMFSKTPYRLACSATPSPNDYMELGNHSEFLGVMTYPEMLSMFFINDPGDVGKWRLKKHAKERDFWEWLCSWAIMVSNPSDFGYDSEGFDLPELEYIEHKIKSPKQKGFLLTPLANTMEERRQVRKETVESRCKLAADIINSTDHNWVIWCGLNSESELLSKLIKESKEVIGSQDNDLKAKLMLDFADNRIKRIITKPKISGFGMNWQNCADMMFVGLSDSWEELYQATRRLWRFGQTKPVKAHIIIDEREGKVLENIKRKDRQARHMIKSMIKYTKDITKAEISKKRESKSYIPTMKMELPKWIG